ncbi:IS110 family transposase, partial [Nocardia amikacinitolerans]
MAQDDRRAFAGFNVVQSDAIDLGIAMTQVGHGVLPKFVGVWGWCPGCPGRWGVADGFLLLLWLHRNGCPAVLDAPASDCRMVATMTGVFRGEGKTDAKDARVIADTARMRGDLQPVTAPDELVAELTQLSSYRSDLMGDWVRGVNQLRAMLASIFPALEAAFDYSTRSPLILVAGLCTPTEVREAGIDGVTTYLTDHGAWRKGIPAMAAQAVAAAGTQDIAVPGEATTATLIKRLAVKLLDLDREIKDLDKQITTRFREHPQAAIIESLPGMGPHLGTEFLVNTGGDAVAEFTTP